MEKRLRFNEDEANYDKYRPLYPTELFDDIIRYSGVDLRSRLIEIGIGTGQATSRFLELGCEVTGIELGDRLAAFVREKYKMYPNFKVINEDFLSYASRDCEKECDLIYSATAFHWLPEPECYEALKHLIRRGGTVALFWNHPFTCREGDESNAASNEVYKALRPSDKKQIEFSEQDTHQRITALKNAGFTDIECHLYKRVRRLCCEEYIGLLNTYSDHRALPAEVKDEFERQMIAAINSVGGFISIYDTLDLYLARLP